MLFIARGMRVALAADDGFSKLLAAGLTFGFALQTFIIVGGVLRVIPLTGITLPFVSYGGSSVVANFVLLAGLLLVSNRANARAMNKPISRLALLATVADGRARRRDDVLAGLGGRRPRRPAGEPGRARGAVHRQARPHRLAATCRSPGTRKKKVSGRTLYFRRYPTNGLAAHVVGYSTQGRARAGLERSRNDYLTASNQNLSTLLEASLDKLKGATIEGNDLVLTLEHARPAGRDARAGGTLRLGRRARARHGQGARDGLVADLQPERDRVGLRRDAKDHRPRASRSRRSTTAPPTASMRRARSSRSSPPPPRSTRAATGRPRASSTPATARCTGGA